MSRDNSLKEQPKEWVQVQKEVFTNWLNTQLIGTDLPPIEDLTESFKDGRYLCVALQNLSGKKIKHSSTITNEYQKMENINNALNVIKSEGIQLVNIGAPDIVAGTMHLVMGLIWKLIQHYQVDTKAKLLQYCNDTLAPYNISVKDFSASWQDGLALCGLVSANTKGLLDMQEVRKNPIEYVPTAITLAHEKLKIPALIKAAHLTEGTPDEKAIMTYISYFPKSKLEGPSEYDKIKEKLPAVEAKFREIILPELSEEVKAKLLAQTKTTIEEKEEKEEKEGEEEETKPQNEGGSILEVVNRLGEYVDHAEARFGDYRSEVGTLREKAARQDELQKSLDKAQADAKVLQQEFKDMESNLKSTVEINEHMKAEINVLQFKLKSLEESRIDLGKNAPKGEVTLMFTDVQSSTSQWEKDPEIMAKAMKIHNALFRRLIEEYNGYEVKTEGDAFMIAFNSPVDAVNLAMRVQLELIEQNWPAELLENEDSKTEYAPGDENTRIYHGLRVRMGMHTGEPECTPDPITGRMDYHGPMVNRSARVGGMAHGGQVFVSGDLWDKIKDDKIFSTIVGNPVAEEKGYFRLKGLDFDMLLVQILPKVLTVRKFGEAKPELPEEAKGLEQKLKELEAKNVEIMKKLKEMKDKSQQAKKKAITLQEQMDSLAVSLGQDDAQKLGIVKEKLQELNDSQQTIVTGLSDANTVYDNIKSSIADVRNQMGVIAEGVRRELSDHISSVKNENEEKTKQLEEKAKELEDRELQIKNLNERIDTLDNNNKDLENKIRESLRIAREEEARTREKVGLLREKHNNLLKRLNAFADIAVEMEDSLRNLNAGTKKIFGEDIFVEPKQETKDNDDTAGGDVQESKDEEVEPKQETKDNDDTAGGDVQESQDEEVTSKED